MTAIRVIVLPYGTQCATVNGMMQGTFLQPRRIAKLSRHRLERARLSPWLSWRPKRSRTKPVLSVAELAECTCPELCDRDHANE